MRRIWLTFVEATIGLGLVALLISYLPTIYAAHSGRERGISLLRPFAGTPPSPVDMLLNLHKSDSLDNPELWRTMVDWMLALDQTHSAFPALCYFPESDAESVVGGLGRDDGGRGRPAAVGVRLHHRGSRRRGGEGPDARPGLRDARPGPDRAGAGLPIDRPVLLADLLSHWTEPAPEISIRREEYIGALDRLTPLLAVPGGPAGGLLAAVLLGPLRL